MEATFSAVTALRGLSVPVVVAGPAAGGTGPAVLQFANEAFAAAVGRPADRLAGLALPKLASPHGGGLGDRLGEVLAGAGPFHGSVALWLEGRYSGDRTLRIHREEAEDGSLQVVACECEGPREDTGLSPQLADLSWIQHQVASGGLDLDVTRQRVAEVAQAVVRADGAVVEEPEDDELVYRAAVGFAEGQEGLRIDMAASLSGRAFRQRESLICSDSTTDDRVADKGRALAVGFRSAVLVPLLHQEHCYGVLKVFSGAVSRFDEQDRMLLELASGLLAASLHNATAFQAEQQRRALLVDAIPSLVSYIDRDGRYREVNAAYERWFNVSARAFRGKHMREMVGDEGFERVRPYVEAALAGDAVSYEAEMSLPDGQHHFIQGDYVPHFGPDGDVRGFYAVVRDMTDSHYAERDYLTGLLNRRKFEEAARNQLEQARRYSRPVSLAMLDLDHFKQVNDHYGHHTGDDILGRVAALLLETVREADVVGRWGGEELVLLLPETDRRGAEELGERLLAQIRRLQHPGVGRVTASMGVVEQAAEEGLLNLEKRADAALYRAKAAGRNCLASGNAARADGE